MEPRKGFIGSPDVSTAVNMSCMFSCMTRVFGSMWPSPFSQTQPFGTQPMFGNFASNLRMQPKADPSAAVRHLSQGISGLPKPFNNSRSYIACSSVNESADACRIFCTIRRHTLTVSSQQVPVCAWNNPTQRTRTKRNASRVPACVACISSGQDPHQKHRRQHVAI